MELVDSETFVITGWTKFMQLENLTTTSAKNELEEIKKNFNLLAESYTELADFITGKTHVYILSYDTGKSGIHICQEKAGQISWLTKLKEC